MEADILGISPGAVWCHASTTASTTGGEKKTNSTHWNTKCTHAESDLTNKTYIHISLQSKITYITLLKRIQFTKLNRTKLDNTFSGYTYT